MLYACRIIGVPYNHTVIVDVIGQTFKPGASVKSTQIGHRSRLPKERLVVVIAICTEPNDAVVVVNRVGRRCPCERTKIDHPSAGDPQERVRILQRVFRGANDVLVVIEGSGESASTTKRAKVNPASRRISKEGTEL